MLYLWASRTLHIHSPGVKQLPAGCHSVPKAFAKPPTSLVHSCGTLASSTRTLGLLLPGVSSPSNETSETWFVHTSTSTVGLNGVPSLEQHSTGEAKLSPANRRVDSADIRRSCSASTRPPHWVGEGLWSDVRVTYTNTGERSRESL